MTQMKASCSCRTLDKHASALPGTSGCQGGPGAPRARPARQHPTSRGWRLSSRLQRLALSTVVTDVRTQPEGMLERLHIDAGQQTVLLQELQAHLEQAGTFAGKVEPL